jgi:transposase-like protein
MGKRYKPEEIVAKLRQVDVLTGQGSTVSAADRQIGVTRFTNYRWRKEYGGLQTNQVKRIKDLEQENARLRKAISDLTLDKLIFQEAYKGNLLTPFSPPGVYRTCPAGAGCLRAPGLPGARPASFDTEQSATWP